MHICIYFLKSEKISWIYMLFLNVFIYFASFNSLKYSIMFFIVIRWYLIIANKNAQIRNDLILRVAKIFLPPAANIFQIFDHLPKGGRCISEKHYRHRKFSTTVIGLNCIIHKISLSNDDNLCFDYFTFFWQLYLIILLNFVISAFNTGHIFTMTFTHALTNYRPICARSLIMEMEPGAGGGGG
jgi:hypothetical protein